ncbi:hypothetical protein BD770DRAFT_385079 [Pilaira anomala]|nr:hypothetical protein BD770DRAFT_385079 [Pilaira anomala]
MLLKTAPRLSNTLAFFVISNLIKHPQSLTACIICVLKLSIFRHDTLYVIKQEIKGKVVKTFVFY